MYRVERTRLNETLAQSPSSRKVLFEVIMTPFCDSEQLQIVIFEAWQR